MPSQKNNQTSVYGYLVSVNLYRSISLMAVRKGSRMAVSEVTQHRNTISRKDHRPKETLNQNGCSKVTDATRVHRMRQDHRYCTEVQRRPSDKATQHKEAGAKNKARAEFALQNSLDWSERPRQEKYSQNSLNRAGLNEHQRYGRAAV